MSQSHTQSQAMRKEEEKQNPGLGTTNDISSCTLHQFQHPISKTTYKHIFPCQTKRTQSPTPNSAGTSTQTGEIGSQRAEIRRI
jgi:hypothetical protein